MKHISAVMSAITEKLCPLYHFIENGVAIEFNKMDTEDEPTRSINIVGRRGDRQTCLSLTNFLDNLSRL